MGEITAYIGLGSNLGDRKQMILRALEMLSGSRGICRKSVSTFLETEPIGIKDQPRYVNCVTEIATTLSPDRLHKVCLHIEERLGRVRAKRWAPRTIDLDILLYGKKPVRLPGLTIPHPEIVNRPFVQVALQELGAHG
jgi:2-amino-4-hydroxy-6-hydroxymethyldihydropteridine diphosphokinase